MKPHTSARWEQLTLLQEHYKAFPEFLRDAMGELGFGTTDVQIDIGRFMERGPQYLMVQAARGQTKTTIGICFVLWTLIHSPSHKILILSADRALAQNIATLCLRLIQGWDILACMRPSKTDGDRTSMEAFDIHHELKGLDKSPSIQCVGIGGTMEGKRADLTLCDDIESEKNSNTAGKRDALARIIHGQFALNIDGRMIFLGTPQSRESVYNALPGRGVTLRVWPGRYPTPAQLPNYANTLAPSIRLALEANPELGCGGGLLGDWGVPTDPGRNSEHILQTKMLGAPMGWFELQYMLDTTLSDSMRFPLKTEQLVVLENVQSRAPLTVTRAVNAHDMRMYTSSGFSFKVSTACVVDDTHLDYTQVWACIDPAGGGANADETAWVVCGLLNSNVYVLGVGAVPGGYAAGTLDSLAQQLSAYPLHGVTIEKNLGNGAYTAVFTPVLRKYSPCQIQESYVKGQKEKRLINTIGPILSRGSLIIDSAVVEQDSRACAQHPLVKRQYFSLFYQLAKIQDTPNCLIHDDRLDALASCCAHFMPALQIDSAQTRIDLDKATIEAQRLDPFGDGRGLRGNQPNMFNKWSR